MSGTQFNPGKLSGNGAAGLARGPRAERIFLVVERYETPAEGFHYAVGRRADAPEKKVKVRLNTVAERLTDRPRENPDKIKAQYVTGENTRDSLADKAKAGIPLLSFDDARRIGSDGDMAEYRAHWPKTMSTNPRAEVLAGMAHIRLRHAGEINGRRVPAQAYVELMKSSAIATSDTIDPLLVEGLSIKDDQERARDPLVIMRVLYDGRVVAQPRLYPATEPARVFDQNLGEYKDILRRQAAAATVDRLLRAAPGRNEFEDRQLDTIRALVAGLKGLDEPPFNSPGDGMLDRIRNLYYGVKDGALQVEVISAEKIDFGADSRKTYLSDKERPHLAAYTIKETVDDKAQEFPGYAETVLAVHRHPDGEPYAVFASPAEMYPSMQKLSDLPLNPTHSPQPSADVAIMDADAVELEESDSYALSRFQPRLL